MSTVSDSVHYALPEEMHQFERDERILFFDPVNFIWFQTDFLGKAVVDGLSRRGCFDDAAEAVARVADAPLDDARTYTGKWIEELLELGFLHEGEYRRNEPVGGIAKHPYILYLHMTARCNLKCPYCYNQENRHELHHAPVGSYEQLVELIDEAAELGFTDLKLTGGEPLLNRDTLPLGRYARSKNFNVNLLTNGTLVNESNARDIVESVSSISLSLDSRNPEEHDVVRGKDTWEKVIRAIELLRREGLGFLHLNSVVTPVNKDSIVDFLEYAWDELKADKVTVAPTGIDVADPDERWGAKSHMLTPDENWDVYERQREFQKRKAREQPPVVGRLSLFTRQCGAGNGLVSVDSNGDLYPCQTMHTPELRCGNVFESGLRQVMEESNLLHRVKHLSVDTLEDCPTCPMRNICTGGCRMEAYSREGRLTARNRDMCPMFFRRALDTLWTTANLPPEERDDENGRKGRSTPLDYLNYYS